MRFYLISDNTDTLLGMRLAGVEGTVTHDSDELKKVLMKAMENEDTALILITEKLVRNNKRFVYDLKLNRRQPLILEIPDRHGSSDITENISDYIETAIGLKL